MSMYRVCWTEYKGITIEAEDEQEARDIVLGKEGYHAPSGDLIEVEITAVDENSELES